MQLAVILLIFAMLWQPTLDAGENYHFDAVEQQREFDGLLKELRCVTCPNQSIADSQAPVAKAMQDEIYRRMQQGETPEAIRHYLQSRYGEAVLYSPLFKGRTYLLWLGPFLMLIIGIALWVRKKQL